MKISVACVMALCALCACSSTKKEVLVPLGRILVYDDAKGSRIIGSITCPARVVSVDWPDKTYFVVKINFDGGYGFVTHGRFAICADETSECYEDRSGSVNADCERETVKRARCDAINPLYTAHQCDALVKKYNYTHPAPPRD